MPEYIWRRSATNAWLVANETTLQKLTRGALAIVERPGKRRLLLEAPGRDARLVARFGGKIVRLGSLHRPAMKPLRIGKRLVVCERAGQVANALVIPAGAAFGTGEHATTAMSLRLLERATRGLTTGWHMLDAGTGSGILALAGKRFGTRSVLAIDNDPLAISTAKANAQANGITGVKFLHADVLKLAGSYDVITANLYSELLIAALPRFRGATILILSGVMRTQEASVLRALKANGFRAQEIRRRGKWIALHASSHIRARSHDSSASTITKARAREKRG